MRPQDRERTKGWFGFRRRRWKRAMWRAIQESAANTNDSMYVNRINPIWGLRAIREFERVNGIHFDPFDFTHQLKTAGMGRLLCGLRILGRITTLSRNHEEKARQ